MLIKLTLTDGAPYYVDAFRVESIIRGHVCGYVVKETPEQVAKAVNAARLLASPYTDAGRAGRSKAIEQIRSDSDLTSMIPMAMLAGSIMFSGT